MLDELIKTVNSEYLIEDNLGQIIESFVSFYGEERREEIEQKIKNTPIITYIPIDCLSSRIIQIKDLKTKELREKIKGQVEVDEKLLTNLFGIINLDNNSIMNYYAFVEEVKEKKDSTLSPDFTIKSLSKNITAENILSGNKDEIMILLDNNRALIESMIRDYNQTRELIKEKEELIATLKKESTKLQNKYLVELAEQYKDFLGDEYTKIIEDYKKNGIIFTYKYPKLKALSSNVFTDSIIDSFDEESEKKLNGNLGDLIKKSRISYFKAMGIDLGDNYEDYLKDERVKQIMPSKDFIEKVRGDREAIKKKYTTDLYKLYPAYQIAFEKMEKRNIDFDGDLANDIFAAGTTAVCTNIRRSSDGIEMAPVIFINMNRDSKGLDMNIFHELNHLIELETLSISEEEYTTKCGWDISTDVIGRDNPNNDRKFELLNEIINDFIAERIARDFHSKGHSIVSNIETARYNSAGYRETAFLARDFFDKFYEPIMESRSKDMSALFDVVGQENFEEFAKLFVEFTDKFGGLKKLKLIEADKKGIKNEDTLKRDEIFIKKNKLISEMEQYSNTTKKTMQ